MIVWMVEEFFDDSVGGDWVPIDFYPNKEDAEQAVQRRSKQMSRARMVARHRVSKYAREVLR